jgi:hypothetical protein
MYEPLETPLADYMTADLPVVADFSDLDGTTFHQLTLIVKRKAGHAGVYCLARDWHETMAYALAGERILNASFVQQIQTLASQLDANEHETVKLQQQLTARQADSAKHAALVGQAVALSEESNRQRLELAGLRSAMDMLATENKRLTTQLAIAASVAEHTAIKPIPLTPEVNTILDRAA